MRDTQRLEKESITTEEQSIKVLWTALQVAEGQTEKRGLQFGQAMYEYREKHSASGRRTDLVSSETRLETFEEFCDRLDIPRATAYRWIAKYEENLGKRPRPTLVTPIDTKLTPAAIRTLVEEPTPGRAKSTSERPSTTPITPTVATREEKDQEQISFLVKRMLSISEALQQVVNDKDTWSKYPEYIELKSLGNKVASLINLL